MPTNKHGLSRSIPEAVRRQIRQQCKFGCVVCRSAIFQYEHIDPEFAEAKRHDPDRMCLLCGSCHDKVTRGLLSKITVADRHAYVRDSAAVCPPFAEFDLRSREISVILGSCRFTGTRTLIKFDDRVALAIEPPEEGSCFPSLSGCFADQQGRELFWIEGNVWHGDSAAWDIDVIGRVITVRADNRRVALQIEVNPPAEVRVVQLNMRRGNGILVLRENGLAVGRIEPDLEYVVGLEAMECLGAEVGVQFDTRTPFKRDHLGLRLHGGKGLLVDGTGMAVGLGAASMTVRGLWIEATTRERTVLYSWPLTNDLSCIVRTLPSTFGQT